MIFIDHLFFNCFDHYKKGAYRKKANAIAVLYITVVEASLLLVLSVVFSGFLQRLHVPTITPGRAWILFIVAAWVLYFKNEIKFSGKKRKVMNANRTKKTSYGIVTLWLIPVVAVFLSILFLRVF